MAKKNILTSLHGIPLRAATAFAEGLLGGPGSTAEFGLNLLNKPIEAIGSLVTGDKAFKSPLPEQARLPHALSGGLLGYLLGQPATPYQTAEDILGHAGKMPLKERKGAPLPTIGSVHERLSKPALEKLGVEIEAQGPIENLVQNVMRGVGAATSGGALGSLAGGGSALTGAAQGLKAATTFPALTTSAAGSVAAQGVSELTNNPWIQLAADFGAQYATGKALQKTGFSPKTEKFAEKAKRHEREAYEQTRKLGEGQTVAAKEFVNKLEDIANQAGKKENILPDAQKKINSTVEKLKDRVQQNKIGSNELVDARTTINDLIKKTNDVHEKMVYQQLHKAINERLNEARAQTPAFKEALNKGDKLHAARNWHKPLTKLFEQYPKVQQYANDPYVGTALTLGGSFLFSNPLSFIKKGLGAMALKKGIKVSGDVVNFIKQPETRVVLKEFATELAKENYQAASRAVVRIQHLANARQVEQSKKKNRSLVAIEKANAGLRRNR